MSDEQDEGAAIACCDFCGDQQDAQTLVSGVGASICETCLARASEALALRRGSDLGTQAAADSRNDSHGAVVVQTAPDSGHRTRAELDEILRPYTNRMLRALDAARQAFEPLRPPTWTEVAGAIRTAAPLFARTLPEGSVQRQVAEDFLLRFYDHAVARADTEYDNAELTIRATGIFELFAQQLPLLRTDLPTISANAKEKERVRGSLGAVLSHLRATESVEVQHEGRYYVVHLRIPQVGVGRKIPTYVVAMRIEPGTVTDQAAVETLRLDRSALYRILNRRWLDGAIAWHRVGDNLGEWLRRAFEEHDSERVVGVLHAMMGYLDRAERVLFLNGLTDFEVLPVEVEEGTFTSDYLRTAWRLCGGEASDTSPTTAAIVQRLHAHEALNVLEKVVALRVLRFWGAGEFVAFERFFRSELKITPEERRYASTLPAEEVFQLRINLDEFLHQADLALAPADDDVD